MNKKAPVLILALLVLLLAILAANHFMMDKESPYVAKTHRGGLSPMLLFSPTTPENSADKNIDGKQFNYMGNFEILDVPAILLASNETGIEVYFRPDAHNRPDMVAVYIEDVGDLGDFWDVSGLFK